MTTPPKVSVLMPIYNTDEQHLGEAINSILMQTMSDFELLILNDSPDNATLDNYVKTVSDSRVRYLRNEENMGLTKSRNKLMSLAKGEYFAVIDHDDIALPTRLEKQLAYMEAHPDTAICGTGFRRIGKLSKRKTIHHPADDETLRAGLFFKCIILHPSSMIRASIVREHQISYDTSYISVNDCKLYAELARWGKLANIPEVLCLYRVHDAMTSKLQREKIKQEQWRLRDEFLQSMGAELSEELRACFNTRFVAGGKIKNQQELQLLFDLCSILLAANERSQLIPVESFKRMCMKYLMKRCAKASLLGGVPSGKLMRETTLPLHLVRKPILLTVQQAIYRLIGK